METNESLINQAFSRINDFRDLICIEIRWICRYFINLWQNEDYHKKLKIELLKPNEKTSLLKVSHPKSNFSFYISIGFDFIDVSAFADINFNRNAIYSVTLSYFVNNPNKYIREIKKLLNKEFRKVL